MRGGHLPSPTEYNCFSLAAVDGQDYIGITEEVLRFESDEDEKRLTVTVIDDLVVEFTDVFQLIVEPGEGELGVKFPSGRDSTVRILDDNDCEHLICILPYMECTVLHKFQLYGCSSNCQSTLFVRKKEVYQ